MKILEPIKIKNVEIKNRIAMPALSLNYAKNGFVSDRLMQFYAERAKGGVGVVFVTSVFNDFGCGSPSTPGVDDDKYLSGLRKLTDVIHSYGAKAFTQILHKGASARISEIGHQAVSSSAIMSQFSHEMPRALTVAEIKQTIENQAEGAVRAKEAGFDGVEYCGAGGYLINQFLSPVTNLRTDGYGGDLKQRLLFPRELIKRAREVVGPDFLISYRTTVSDFVEGGITINEVKIIAKAMQDAGVDVISHTGGWHQAFLPQVTAAVPRGVFTALSQQIKDVVTIPVIGVQRINTPLLAERLLEEEQFDMIGMARALIADPELPNKLIKGHIDSIRPCIACCQGCFDSVTYGREIHCLMNAAVGREGDFDIKRVRKGKKVVVVGGGPGGMEAARVLRLRGHKVTLYEKDNKLGGQLNLAAIPPGKEEFANGVQYLSSEMKRLRVKVELSKEFTPELLASENPDAVIIATGASPVRPTIPGINGKNVVYANDVLEGKAQVGKKVVVIGGGSVGAETALYLANIGTVEPASAFWLLSWGAVDAQSAINLTRKGTKKVTVIELLPKIGLNIGSTNRWVVTAQLRHHNVDMLTEATPVRIIDKGVIYKQGGDEKLAEADTVVIAVGTRASDELIKKLKKVHPSVYAIGDCVSPRLAIDAIYEGSKVAREI